MRAFFFVVFCQILAYNVAFSQKDPQMDKADALYEQLGYQKAIEIYEENGPDLQAMRKIANGYRLNHDTQNAEKWFAQIVQNTTEPLDLLHYAQALQSNGNLALAKDFFLKYARLTESATDARGTNLAAAIDHQLTSAYPSQAMVQNARQVNSEGLDFSPAFFQDGIVFVSNRRLAGAADAKDPWTGDDFASLYFSKQRTQGDLEAPVLFSTGGLKSRLHEGPVAFSRSGDQVFFTRNELLKKSNGPLRLKIFVARRQGGTWSDALKIDLGSPTASDAHPSLSSNGRQLYFASDREGGFGGMDIYVSTFSNGQWGLPVNLGRNVNTAGNEVFPFMFDDGTLYFASDGWGGAGGLDIFLSKKAEDGNLGKTSNLGAPFNSSMDDFGYILHPLGLEGYFSSARPGGLGKDDLYHFVLTTTPSNEPLTVEPIALCVAEWPSKLTISNAKVTVLTAGEGGTFVGFDGNTKITLLPSDTRGHYQLKNTLRDPFASTNGINETFETGPDGQIQLRLPANAALVFLVNAPGRLPVVYDLEEWLAQPNHCVLLEEIPSFSHENGDGGPPERRKTNGSSSKHLPIGKLEDLPEGGIIIELENIYHDLGNADIRPEAAVELDKLVEYMIAHPYVSAEMRSHTDSRGDDGYNRLLSLQRAQAAMAYVIQQGIAANRVSAIGFGEDLLVNECDDGVACIEEAHQRNRRTEVRIFKE